MAKWEQLIIARERKHFSQAEAAERVNVGLVTYQRWEAGRSRPQPHHMRSLSRVFRELFEGEEETSFQPEVSSEHVTSHSPLPPGKSSTPAKHAGKAGMEIDEAQAFIASHLTTCLLSLAFSPHPNCTDKRRAIRRSIKEFDTMNTDNQNYPITRREALSTLATLPLITLGLTIPGKSLPTTHYGAAIAHCAASLEACWDLRKRDDASDRLLAYQCATQYIPLLTTIAHHTSQYRQEALDLATRYTLIKAFVARHLTGLPEAIQLGINAVALSKETGDIPLQLYAYAGLTYSYLFVRNYPRALATAQQAATLLRQATQVPNAQPFHPQILGTTYLTLAISQAKSGKSPEDALGRATELDLSDESLPFMDCKQPILFVEAGKTCCYQGDQTQAMKWLSMRIDPETLAPKIAQSEIGRVETLNLMTLSSLRAQDRDLEKTLHLWTAGMDGAIALHSELRFNEALSNYELMEAVWPSEKRIAKLRDHIVHWEE